MSGQKTRTIEFQGRDTVRLGGQKWRRCE
jgi:hypothetical protein